MHLLVRETHSLDEDATADDLGQSPGDIVVLSFSDSDLGALAQAWQNMGPNRPSLRLANLARLKHPMSVDIYLEDIVAKARCVILRLLGGLDYWRYGAEETASLCRRLGIALAVIPGDGRQDPTLAELSTVSADTLTRLDDLLAQGGATNMRHALTLAAHAGGLTEDDHATAEPIPLCGIHDFKTPATGPLAVIVFYRSYLLAGDLAPLEALSTALADRGMTARGLYVASLKEPQGATFVSNTLQAWRPAIVISATGFSARQGDNGAPLDAADVPVIQLILSGASEQAWSASSRGLSQADFAMQVVLPELDGRLMGGVVSFKEAEPQLEGLDFARQVHRPQEAGITAVADRIAGWSRLGATPRPQRRLMLILSDYPNAGGQIGHAVGLDGFASAHAILDLLQSAGYQTAPTNNLVHTLTAAPPAEILSLATYQRLFATLPTALQAKVIAAWGDPTTPITLRHTTQGAVTLAVEPDRGSRLDRKSGYHDPDLPPSHAFLGFHLWRRHVLDSHAIIHLGAHGALEWLPGKAVALSDTCVPQALIAGTPVIYPYIVNNPGEAACAKRRLGAVTIGHLTPPLRTAGLHGDTAELERLIDEYAAADGLDRRRAAMLRTTILQRAEDLGLLTEAGATRSDPTEALACLDAYLCDVKDLQIRDGLHIFGRAPAPEHRAHLLEALQKACPTANPLTLEHALDRSPAAEAHALITALDAHFVPPGPAGAPTRGRADVLPTGRNLTTSDPRGMPTRAAVTLAERAAADLLRRHRQDHGENPRSVVIDLWGSASLRTGGEDLALGLILLGAKPIWDAGSNRVTGIEILPLATLDRPRVDVTLRVSGLFRDAFETQIALFDSAVRAIATRDEAIDWNPLVAATTREATARVFGAAEGSYGAGADRLARGTWTTPAELGADYLQASATAYGQGLDGIALPDAFAARVATADAFVHQQDHREIDLLDGATHAAHEGGFAAAATALGATPALYHADTSNPEAPRTRTLAEELARVVRGRAANPVWIAGQMRHGYRGAAEIARAVEGLSAFAATLPARLDAQFDLLFAATLGTPEVEAFLARENPAAHADMQRRFEDARQRGLWRTPRNDLTSGALS